MLIERFFRFARVDRKEDTFFSPYTTAFLFSLAHLGNPLYNMAQTNENSHSDISISYVLGVGSSYSRATLHSRHISGNGELETEVKGVFGLSFQAGIRFGKKNFLGLAFKTAKQGYQLFVHPTDSLKTLAPPYFYSNSRSNKIINAVAGRTFNFRRLSLTTYGGMDYLPQYTMGGGGAWIFSTLDPDTVFFESKPESPHKFNWLLNGGLDLTYRIINAKSMSLDLGLSSAYSYNFRDLYRVPVSVTKSNVIVQHDIRAGRDYWIHQLRMVVTPKRN